MALIRKRLKKSESMQIRFTPDVKEALKAEAEERGTTIASIIDEAIVRYFDERPEPTLTESLERLENRLATLEKRVADVEKSVPAKKKVLIKQPR